MRNPAIVGLIFLSLGACSPNEPRAIHVAPPVAARVVSLEINPDGTVLWNRRSVSMDELDRLFRDAAKQRPQPDIHLLPNRLADYATVAKVLALAQRDGATRLGFVGIESDH